MEFCVLGTLAGGNPHLRGHPSATALKLEGAHWLFDCGEGTQRQLLKAGVSRSSLAAIFITHAHGDHILGLPGLLASMASDHRRHELRLFGPPGIRAYLHTTLEYIDVQLPFALIVQELATDEPTIAYATERYDVSAAALDHRLPSFGFRVEEIVQPNVDMHKARALGLQPGPMIGAIKRNGFVRTDDGAVITLEQIQKPPRKAHAFAYITDTRPCRNGLELAREVDTLLHEATFDAAMQTLAGEFGHSTAADAARIAAQAKARTLYLIHISSRYPQPEALKAEARRFFPAAYVAEELRWVHVERAKNENG